MMNLHQSNGYHQPKKIMMNNQVKNKNRPESIITFRLLAGAFIIATSCMLSGCDSTDAKTDKISDVVMKPDEATLQLAQNNEIRIALDGNSVDFAAFALTESGKQVAIPEDATTTWTSTNAAVFTVTDKGVATGQGTGEAFCVIEMRRPPVTGIVVITFDSARVAVF